jgi:hypothetical protein
MRFRNEEEIRRLVRRFEECELSLAEFSHAAHVMVGTVYVHDDPESALDRMRAGLLRFTAHYGKTGVYKEDVTREWIERLTRYIEAHPAADLADAVSGAVKEFGTQGPKPMGPVTSSAW